VKFSSSVSSLPQIIVVLLQKDLTSLNSVRILHVAKIRFLVSEFSAYLRIVAGSFAPAMTGR
jgi:hypothetical protein